MPEEVAEHADSPGISRARPSAGRPLSPALARFRRKCRRVEGSVLPATNHTKRVVVILAVQGRKRCCVHYLRQDLLRFKTPFPNNLSFPHAHIRGQAKVTVARIPPVRWAGGRGASCLWPPGRVSPGSPQAQAAPPRLGEAPDSSTGLHGAV